MSVVGGLSGSLLLTLAPKSTTWILIDNAHLL